MLLAWKFEKDLEFEQMSSALAALKRDLEQLADPVTAANRARFFKTAAGQYGEGDQFIGLTVPAQRRVAGQYVKLSLEDVAELLASAIHECRFIALAILVDQYRRAAPDQKQRLVDFYLAHLGRVNNWDLVDASAPYILGEHLKDSEDRALDQLAASPDLWTRRVAMVATLAIIKAGNVEPTLRIAEMLLSDRHDLIHKAVGWALREVGRVQRGQLLRFLDEHYAKLPRTTLRYAIEHLTPEQRKAALTGNFLR